MTNPVYEEKKKFVEEACYGFLSIYPRFEGIDYAADAQTCEEYIRIKDEVNGPMFVNVTGNSVHAIAQEISRVVLSQRPVGLVKDPIRRNDIAPLFRSGRREAAYV